jgi:hypothetical protein
MYNWIILAFPEKSTPTNLRPTEILPSIKLILVMLIVARTWPEMGRLKTLNAEAPIHEPV